VRLLRDVKTSAGRLLRGMEVRLPEREAAALVEYRYAVAIVAAPAVAEEPEE
jgi:hypothetical protein